MKSRPAGVHPWERWFWAALSVGLVAILAVILFGRFTPDDWLGPQPPAPVEAPVKAQPAERPELGANALIAQEHYNQAQELLRQGNLAEAREFLARSTELVPTFAPAWNNLGVTETRLGNLPQAEAAFNRARQASPLYLPAYFNLAGLLAGQNRGEEAMKVLEDGIAALGPRPEFIQRLAELGLKLGLEERALATMERFQDQTPKRAELAELKALLLMRLRREDQAQRLLEPLAEAESDPAGNGARQILARILLHRGQQERAEALLKVNLALNPDSHGDRLALASTQLTRTRHGVMVMPLSLRGQVAMSRLETPLFAAPNPAAASAGALKPGDSFMILPGREGWSQVLVEAGGRPVWAPGALQAIAPPAPGVWPLPNLIDAD